MNKTRENSPCWCVWGQIKWDGYQGRKENLSDPRGFGPTDAGNSGEQTVYWKCKSTWKLGLFYQAKRYSHVTDIVGGQICFYNALGFFLFFYFQHDGNNIQGGKIWNSKCLPQHMCLPGIWGKIMSGASLTWCLFCQICPSPCSWHGGEQVPDKNCPYLRGKYFLYQYVLLCSESQMLTSALAWPKK